MQSNINPHFMSNTLCTIFWKSMDLTEDITRLERCSIICPRVSIINYGFRQTVLLAEEIYHTAMCKFCALQEQVFF